MADQMKSGEPVLGAVQGPPAPEVIISDDNGRVELRGMAAQMWRLALAEMQNCGRSPATDQACGDMLMRAVDAQEMQIQPDEHSATRADRSEAA